MIRCDTPAAAEFRAWAVPMLGTGQAQPARRERLPAICEPEAATTSCTSADILGAIAPAMPQRVLSPSRSSSAGTRFALASSRLMLRARASSGLSASTTYAIFAAARRRPRARGALGGACRLGAERALTCSGFPPLEIRRGGDRGNRTPDGGGPRPHGEDASSAGLTRSSSKPRAARPVARVRAAREARPLIETTEALRRSSINVHSCGTVRPHGPRARAPRPLYSSARIVLPRANFLLAGPRAGAFRGRDSPGRGGRHDVRLCFGAVCARPVREASSGCC